MPQYGIMIFMMRKILIFLMIILFANVVLAINLDNPKSAEEITLKLIQSGNLIPSGHVSQANITLYIPQTIESMNITGVDSWKYIYDEFGNKMILLEWNNFDSTRNYRLESIVKNSATHTTEKSIGSDERYTRETSTIIFNDDIRKAAYPYEKTLKKAAELTIFVNKIMTYDISLAGSRKPSDWVLQNKRGVCVEYSNLLASLLRVSGIPTRYVVGYAYSDRDKKMIGHAWIEVLASDKSWIPFDPTWLQGGTIDATHIKTASLLDSNQSDKLTYLGATINWQKDDDNFEIIDYKNSEINISVDGIDSPSNGYGYVKTIVGKTSFGYECTIYDLTAASCIDNNKNTMLEIYEPERKFWTCGEQDIYWFFKPETNENNYICPVIVYDQLGNKGEKRVEVRGYKDVQQLSINGPNTVEINQKFNLTTGVENFIFYSPDFGLHESNIWSLSVSEPGTYSFYLYSDNSLAKKDVDAKEVKEFDLSVIIPNNSSVNSNFTASISIQNLISKNKEAIIKIESESTIEKNISFAPGEIKNYEFNLSSKTPGLNKITVSILSDGITSYTSSIIIYSNKNFFQEIIDAIVNFFSSLVNSISNLFG